MKFELTMKTNFGVLIKSVLIINLLFISTAYSQSDVEENRLKIESEPFLMFNKGLSINVMYNVTKNNNLGVGVYLFASDVPNILAENMFNNFTDSTSARVADEFAVNLRYRIRLFKNVESNPYIGLILGWESLDLQRTGYSDMSLSTFFATPHVGYEIYLYKKMFYLNPQLRMAFYMGGTSSDKTRDEALNTYLLLPSLSLGVRF
jgi:hypothetical protein